MESNGYIIDLRNLRIETWSSGEAVEVLDVPSGERVRVGAATKRIPSPLDSSLPLPRRGDARSRSIAKQATIADWSCAIRQVSPNGDLDATASVRR
jgi:hypothetical protein